MPVPSFTLVSLTCAIEVLRMANHLSGSPVYKWTIVSPGGGWIIASNGLSIETLPAESVDSADVVFVVGGTDIRCFSTRDHLAMLRRFARLGCVMGSLCTGAYTLARAGLLFNYSCASHWENIPALTEEFPDTHFVKELFVIDRDRISCAGGIAPLDLMLNIIVATGNAELAQGIARQFLIEEIRNESHKQRPAALSHVGSQNRPLSNVISLMEERIEDPLSRAELARLSGMSQRQLQRLFRSKLGQTPTRYYISLRLHRARQLLLQTTLPLLQVTMACGFRSSARFSKQYKDLFGLPPTHERRRQLSGTRATSAF